MFNVGGVKDLLHYCTFTNYDYMHILEFVFLLVEN